LRRGPGAIPLDRVIGLERGNSKHGRRVDDEQTR
jgi:hypothetical protein